MVISCWNLIWFSIVRDMWSVLCFMHNNLVCMTMIIVLLSSLFLFLLILFFCLFWDLGHKQFITLSYLIWDIHHRSIRSSRSSRPKMFCKKAILENFAKSTRKYLRQSPLIMLCNDFYCRSSYKYGENFQNSYSESVKFVIVVNILF